MANRKDLAQYNGRLNTAQAGEGIQAALKNARALFADAQLLLENERWQRAAALSILAIEETGKIPVIREILLARHDVELREAWRSYRSHTAKNVMYILPDLVAKGARHLDDFRRIYDESGNHAQVLDAAKQIALYSDACRACHWSIPEEVIDPELAGSLFAIAKVLVRDGLEPFSTKEELDIWVKHMRRVWKGSPTEMKKALVACYAEARAKGVLQGRFAEAEMMDFVFRSPRSSVT